MSKKFPKDKCKLNLKLSSTRVQLRKQKIDAQTKTMERDIAELFKANKEQSARIKTELVIHNDNMLIALEYLGNMLEMLKARLEVIVEASGLTEDVATGVITVIYCANRVEVPELKELSTIFGLKYGKEWVAEVSAGNDAVPARLVRALATTPPPDAEVNRRLYTIAEKYGLTEKQDFDDVPPPAAPGGGGAPRRGSGGKGKKPASSSGGSGGGDDISDLEARFAALQSPPE